MRVVVVREFGEPEVMRLEEWPTPRPGSGQVLVRIRAIGVNPVDAYIRAGIGARPDLPYTPGDDAAGEIEAVGADLGQTDLRVGARVYLNGSLTGTYADHALCLPPHVHPLPDRCSFAEGAAVGVPYGTAYRALFQRAAAEAGETVLVHGATGGVGLAAVQLAVAAGLTVTASGGSEEGRRLALANGAAHVVDHGSDEHFEEILRLTDGRGVDVILEMRSDLNLGRDLPLLAHRGRVVCIGNRGPLNEGRVSVNARDLMRRDAAVLGMLLPNADDTSVTGIHRELVEGLADGRLRPVAARGLSLADAARAHVEVMQRPSMGKIILLTD